jgi:NAD(P)-dependent dehydrogenase (short-subunit alcohol dehydrogenase family)
MSDLERQNERIQEVIRKANESNPSGKYTGIPCDVTQEGEVQKLVDETISLFGRLDCVSIYKQLYRLDFFNLLDGCECGDSDPWVVSR